MTEPVPSPTGPLAAALAQADATLPPVHGLAPGELARWFARSIGAPWIQEIATSPREGEEPWATARGGLLFVATPLSAKAEAALEAEVELGALRVVRVSGEPITETSAFVAAVRECDRLHAVALDPALADLRRSLLSHARSAAPVHLTGPPGTDAVALSRWAHAVLDDRPLSTLHGNGGAARAGEWLLVQDIEELGPANRQVLEERLRALEPRPVGRIVPRRARPEHPALRAIIGSSGGLVDVLEKLLVLAPTRLPVLVVGEPGAGKESLAKAVHDASGRKGPFVALDMGALPEGLAEAELFGHRKGAFTGADRARVGAFRSADGGTLFLDEIGNVSPALQAKLLRVLQQGVVRPLGDDRSVQVDVRVVAATNADLHTRVRQGEFRRDLLGRLDGATLRLPPLRERLDDLDDLARHLLDRPGDPWCDAEAYAALSAHTWPGNVRELDNVLRFAAAVVGSGGTIRAEHLGPLAPRNRRPTPVLVTSTSTAAAEASWGLDRSTQRRLTATTLRVPSLAERGSPSLKGRIFDGLRGRVIASDALRLLCDRPWWGNLPELDAVLGALRALPPGPITTRVLSLHLPHLATDPGTTPIRTLLSPSRVGDSVDGLMRDFVAPALLVGRVRSVDELRRAAQHNPRAARWVEAIEQICGWGAQPACLDLGLLRRLSRAHVLVARGVGGLQVHVLPSVGRAVLAGPLAAGAATQPVSVGEPVSLGEAGEIRVTDPSGRAYLQLFVFAGAVAFDDHAVEAAARFEAERPTGDATAQDTRHLTHAPGVATAGPPTPPATPNRVWALGKQETDAVVDLLMAYRGGSLKDHVDRRLAAPTPELAHLASFLREAPRLSQYLGRLVDYGPNEEVRSRLRAELAGAPDGELRLALWPKGIRRSLK